MYKMQSFFILIFAAVVCLARANSKHVIKGRCMKLDICEECTELLNEAITKALEELEQFSKCLLVNVSNAAAILDGSEKNSKEAKDEMVAVLPTFIHKIKLIQNEWGKSTMPSCSQNVEKHLTGILCLSRGVSKKAERCLARERIEGPKHNLEEYTRNYIRLVYSTLEGFVSNLQ